MRFGYFWTKHQNAATDLTDHSLHYLVKEQYIVFGVNQFFCH